MTSVGSIPELARGGSWHMVAGKLKWSAPVTLHDITLSISGFPDPCFGCGGLAETLGRHTRTVFKSQQIRWSRVFGETRSSAPNGRPN